MNDKDSEDTQINREENGRGPSWPYPQIHFLYVVIYFVTPYTGETIGLILFIALMSVCTWAAISKNEYEQLKQNYPSLWRGNYIANMLILPVIVPLLIFVILLVFEIL